MLEENSFPDHLQKALKLQDLKNQDINTKESKMECCGNLDCINWSCSISWNRFNFDHCYSVELAKLGREFNLNF